VDTIWSRSFRGWVGYTEKSSDFLDNKMDNAVGDNEVTTYVVAAAQQVSLFIKDIDA